MSNSCFAVLPVRTPAMVETAPARLGAQGGGSKGLQEPESAVVWVAGPGRTRPGQEPGPHRDPEAVDPIQLEVPVRYRILELY